MSRKISQGITYWLFARTATICWFNAHEHKTGDEIWEDFRKDGRRAEIKGAIFERDVNSPSFTEILDELEQVQNLLRKQNFAEKSAV